PNLQGSAPMGNGQGPGLSLHDLGEQSGVEFVTLLQSEIPVHTHSLQGNFNLGDNFTPQPTFVLANSDPGLAYSTEVANLVQLAPQAVAPAGGSLPHNNMQPFLCVIFIIALQGVFPPRT